MGSVVILALAPRCPRRGEFQLPICCFHDIDLFGESPAVRPLIFSLHRPTLAISIPIVQLAHETHRRPPASTRRNFCSTRIGAFRISPLRRQYRRDHRAPTGHRQNGSIRFRSSILREQDLPSSDKSPPRVGKGRQSTVIGGSEPHQPGLRPRLRQLLYALPIRTNRGIVS